eukprot:scaffold305533_cov12-Tisochrysis_lutea.AAC.1
MLASYRYVAPLVDIHLKDAQMTCLLKVKLPKGIVWAAQASLYNFHASNPVSAHACLIQMDC